MFFSFKNKEKERFKKAFSDELLQFHFERLLGKNPHNERSWRVLLEERIEPHTEILCDLSRWLIARGWSKEVVKELFFVELEVPDEAVQKKKTGRLRSIFRMFKP
jgi:hypothetical protein